MNRLLPRSRGLNNPPQEKRQGERRAMPTVENVLQRYLALSPSEQKNILKKSGERSRPAVITKDLK
jgi:hypothetical protein